MCPAFEEAAKYLFQKAINRMIKNLSTYDIQHHNGTIIYNDKLITDIFL